MAFAKAAPPLLAAGATLLALRCLSTRRFASSTAGRLIPASRGDLLADSETPCLCVDLQAVDENIRRLESLVAGYPGKVNVRPIVKAHKTTRLAKYQLQSHVTRGICCAKVCEVEAMLRSGLTDILVSNEIIGERKLRRLTDAMRAANTTSLRAVVDSPFGVSSLQAAASEAGVTFDVLIELSCGQKRCGARPDSVVPLARLVKEAPSLRLVGIQAYQGAAQHIRSKKAMEEEIANVASLAAAAKSSLLQERLFEVPEADIVVTGGGSGTLEYEMSSGVFTELQPGSYLFNDADYSKNLAADGGSEGDRKWKASLFVLATVMSSTRCDDGSCYVIVDAGIKAHSIDSGMPALYGRPDVVCQNGGDEHFKLIYPVGQAAPRIGDKVLIQPGHVDPTFNMHDHVVIFRSSKLLHSSDDILAEQPCVEDVWDVEARGPGF
eukprot:TRINITY_DN21084_c0_g1_i2.p1 TRINITY_DN21084_c0_g1~~TRINITY_DN21084_c0_g1_i2.p1  ORF type:complete len:448 (+),score=137.46 TRINITY_DN21084_c0_g1_i2:35-1345(+)